MAKSIVEVVTGDLSEKRRFRAIQKRAKALPADYKFAYDEIQRYIWTAAGAASIGTFENLVDLFEEGAAVGRQVLDITGDDVAAFADDLVYGEPGWREQQRAKLNRKLADRLGTGDKAGAVKGTVPLMPCPPSSDESSGPSPKSGELR